MNSTYLRLTAPLLSLILLACSAEATNPTVTTRFGDLIGVTEGESNHFRGIPYAQPPVGALRWQPPQETDAWDTAKDASEWGPRCPQRFKFEESSEDCLTLNISAPKSASTESKLPVLVWIHGGGLVGGTGASNYTSGKLWNRENIVFVSLNYRLGALGFFSHPALEQSAGTNYGLMDMIAALKWVKQNIAAFGGNPERVTIMGSSAGGMAVQMLMVSPAAKGLFQGAISESGYGTWRKPRSRAVAPLEGSVSAEQIATKLVDRVLGENTNNVTVTADQLRAISPKQWVNSIEGFYLPIIDGTTLPEESGVLFALGKQHSVPYISGGTSFDGSVFPYSGLTQADLLNAFTVEETDIRNIYSLDDDNEGVSTQYLFGDMRYLIAAKVSVANMEKIEQPGYLYFFDYLLPEQRDELPGAPHGSEVNLLFNLDQNEVANQMRKYWVNFIKTGNPNGPGLPEWPIYTKNRPEWMVFRDKSSVETEIRAEKLRVIERSWERRVNSALGIN